jgi:DNA-binding transcriptional regulator GbsR (MarR family)
MLYCFYAQNKELYNSMKERIERMRPLLDERQWRLFLANEAMSVGYGGISEVSRITGVSRTTITRGIEELTAGEAVKGRVRNEGGGRNYVEEIYPNVEAIIRQLVDGSTYGNPERVLSYTTESLRKIECELKAQGINVSYKTIGKILEAMGYSKQINQKMLQVGNRILTETHNLNT